MVGIWKNPILLNREQIPLLSRRLEKLLNLCGKASESEGI